ERPPGLEDVWLDRRARHGVHRSRLPHLLHDHRAGRRGLRRARHLSRSTGRARLRRGLPERRRRRLRPHRSGADPGRGHARNAARRASGTAGRGTGVTIIETETIGDAWLETARRILRDGADAVYDGEPTRELALVAIHVGAPDPDDATIARLADPEWLDWMRRNFTEPGDVAE